MIERLLMDKKRVQRSAVCDCRIIHEETVEKVRAAMPKAQHIIDTADFFKVFGDSTRMGILYALSHSEMCSCDICALLGMTQSAVSHQMRILKQARLVRYRREGKIVYFRLDDDHVVEILNLGFKDAGE